VVTFVGWYDLWCVVVTVVGWYQGERLRDGESGWFPGNYTSEVASAHVRARNLKQRYRLLALSGNFLEAQRKDKQAK
jgi:neuronal guanine nucleotide exchange factor